MTRPKPRTPETIKRQRRDRRWRREARDARLRKQREPMTPQTNRRLHAVAGRVYGGTAHRELHRCAAVVFGADHVSDLSEPQAWVLIHGLKGKRTLDPSTRREGKLRELIALFARGGPECRTYVKAVARDKFHIDIEDEHWLDDCGIGRLAALCKVAHHWLEKHL